MSTNVYDLASRHESFSPEALFISALLDSGKYAPSAYGIKDAHFGSWQQVNEFCKDYQSHSGKAPPVSLVCKKFPSFPYEPEPDPNWSAAQVLTSYNERVLRKGMADAINGLRDDGYQVAVEALRSAIGSTQATSRQGRSFTEIDTRSRIMEQPAPVCLNHSDNLQRITDGIRPGNVWYVGARLGVGKSWVLQQMAVAAAEAGWNVNFYSLEMTEEEVSDRLARIALRTVTSSYDRMDPDERDERLLEWQEVNGTIMIRDLSWGPLDASIVASHHEPETVSIIDYATLMRPLRSLSKNSEHWQSAQSISLELKRTALEYGIPIISAAQINRAGARTSRGDESDTTPGAEHIAESDQIGKDADLIVTLRRQSTRVLMCRIVKNRHGPSGRAWTQVLDIARSRFGDIDSEEALALIEQDNANEGR